MIKWKKTETITYQAFRDGKLIGTITRQSPRGWFVHGYNAYLSTLAEAKCYVEENPLGGDGEASRQLGIRTANLCYENAGEPSDYDGPLVAEAREKWLATDVAVHYFYLRLKELGYPA